MNFLATLLKGIAFVPAVVHGIEALFGNKTGADKKAAALSFIGSALSITDAVAGKQIVDPPQIPVRPQPDHRRRRRLPQRKRLG